MKPYKVDVPVLLFVFIRPETLLRVFKAVKKARPSILILASDGPREGISTDKERILESRKIVEDIDWDCKVYKLYYDTNQGLYEMIKNALDFTFSITDRCIYLEDDVVPSQSFFPFCAELLEKYKDDLRINMICGMNHLGIYQDPDTDYFFSEAAAIWGFAIWKRTYQGFYDSDYGKSTYILDRLKDKSKNYKSFYNVLEEYYTSQTIKGHPGGPEFYLRFMQYSQSMVNILPTKNLVKNIGYGEGSTHSPISLKKIPRGIQKLFNMKFHELTFPLKHPQYVISDIKYEKMLNRLTGNNHPLISAYRRAARIVRSVYYNGNRISINKFVQRESSPPGDQNIFPVIRAIIKFINLLLYKFYKSGSSKINYLKQSFTKTTQSK